MRRFAYQDDGHACNECRIAEFLSIRSEWYFRPVNCGSATKLSGDTSTLGLEHELVDAFKATMPEAKWIGWVTHG